MEVTAYAFGFGAVFFGAFVVCFRLAGARFPFTVRYNWATERVSIRMLMRTVESDDGCFPMYVVVGRVVVTPYGMKEGVVRTMLSGGDDVRC